MAEQPWDLLLINALVFDGTGNEPEESDIAISEGKIVKRGHSLETQWAKSVIDANGKWCMPGLLDIHTHLDIEVEVEPWLPENVRHGTTTVIMGNCSLGTAFGNQQTTDQNPIVDCFTRVENIPKFVLNAAATKMTWNNTGDYINHLNSLPLGPNVTAFIPYSMLRIEVMGLQGAISRTPTQQEQQKMKHLLEQAMLQGYIGMSNDALPLHYLAEGENIHSKIPAQHIRFSELKDLLTVLRDYDRVWQTTPDTENKLTTICQFALTSGRLHGKTLRTTATAAMDLNTNKSAHKGLIKLSRWLNSDFMAGHFRFQALSCPFRIYAEGATTPLMEESAAFRELISTEADDSNARQILLNDPAYIKRFRKAWHHGKKGFGLARLLNKLEIEPTTFSRQLKDMFIDSCPVESWSQQNLEVIYQRLLSYQRDKSELGLADDELTFFKQAPCLIGDDADFIIYLLKSFDRQFRWWVITGNERPAILKRLLFDRETLPGFNDSGAHLINMAYFDGNLRTLQMAQQDSLELVSTAVKRLTRDPAELFGLEVGTIEVGSQADLILIDPNELAAYQPWEGQQMIYRNCFEHPQMVNRSEGVVTHTVIAGKVLWENNQCSPLAGKVPFGRALTTSRGLMASLPIEQAESVAT